MSGNGITTCYGSSSSSHRYGSSWFRYLVEPIEGSCGTCLTHRDSRGNVTNTTGTNKAIRNTGHEGHVRWQSNQTDTDSDNGTAVIYGTVTQDVTRGRMTLGC